MRLINLWAALPYEILPLAFALDSNELKNYPSLSDYIARHIPMPYRPIDLGVLNEADARELLRVSAERAGSTHLRDHYLDAVIKIVSRNPMCLKLAARLLSDEGGSTMITANSEFMAKLRAERIQAYFTVGFSAICILMHSAIAHPGLIVRRITPDVIRYILAALVDLGFQVSTTNTQYSKLLGMRQP